MPIPLCKLDFGSFDNAFINILASSNVCTTAYFMTKPIVSAKPYVSSNPFKDSGWISRKMERKEECSGSLLGLNP